MHTRAVLVGEGYSVRTALSAVDALEMLEDTTPDLVIADVRMREMDGVELTRAVHEIARNLRTPVVLFSAMDRDVLRELAQEAGCEGYLEKPLGKEGLRTIQEVLIRHLADRQAGAPPTAVPPQNNG
jgi:chemosensory pili system protein ChpA (sensor histidine kinase/response regulator)